MSELVAAAADPQVGVEDPKYVIERVGEPPVPIAEPAAAFSTAAAVGLPRTQPTRGVIAVLHKVFPGSSVDAQQAPRHYPPRRAAFLDQAAMAREMRRL